MASERCADILKKICADAGRRETSPFCREVAQHLESCADCRDQALSLRGTLELVLVLGTRRGAGGDRGEAAGRAGFDGSSGSAHEFLIRLHRQLIAAFVLLVP